MTTRVRPEDSNSNELGWPDMVDPIAGSGLRLTNATLNTNTTATVVVGGVYVFTALVTGGFYLGLADVTTAANVRWVCPQGRSITFRVPIGGGTTLHYATDTSNGIGYLRRLS